MPSKQQAGAIGVHNAVQRNEPEEAYIWDVNESEGVQSSRRCAKCEQCVEKRRKWFVFVLFPAAFVARLVVTVFQRFYYHPAVEVLPERVDRATVQLKLPVWQLPTDWRHTGDTVWISGKPWKWGPKTHLQLPLITLSIAKEHEAEIFEIDTLKWVKIPICCSLSLGLHPLTNSM